MRERTEINATIQKLLKEARDKDKTSSFSAIWERVKKENPKLFGDLEAQDWMEDDKAEEQEQNGNTVDLNDGSYHNSMGLPRAGQPLSRILDKSNRSSDYAEAPKHYQDV